VVVATKGSNVHDYGRMYADVSYHHLVAACHRSLKRLATDYIDLYFIHTASFDAREEDGIRRALDELRQEGSIRLAGVSIATNLDKGIQLIRAGWVDALMIYFNMFYQQAARQLLPLAAEHGTGIVSAVPFSWGVLTGKYTSAEQVPDDDVRKARVANAATGGGLYPSLEQVDEIKHMVEPSGMSLVAAALQFVLAHPAVSTVVPGARTVEQLEQNVAAVNGPPLPPSVYSQLVQRFGS
jgi:aryl-alcohol dehydrogenase-like predicted oxidoreductase